jgi:predicted transcriptional regulator
MTLTLTPDTEARVRSVAEMRGQGPEDALIALLGQALAEAERDAQLTAELHASVEDHADGRSMTIEEYRTQAIARRQKRDVSRIPSENLIGSSA